MELSKKTYEQHKSNIHIVYSTTKKLMFLSLLFFAFLFTGCQNEVDEIIQGNEEEELLVANSNVAVLMKATVTKDGSKDNILDKASCINIKLPVHVYVNGLEIIVDSEEDFDTIEDIFDEYYDDDDYLEYVYPIVIVLSDYSDVTIENKDQLQEYVDLCDSEEDDDIECVDFKYPIFYSVFNTNQNTVSTVEINNDRDMYHFIKDIKPSDVISLNFPITLVFSDETELVVDDLKGLEEALSGAEFCDEDDDNDYGDDDFNLERLNELLVKCPWIVHDLKRDDISLTDNYREYLIIFKPENVVKVRRRNGEVITGKWQTYKTDHGVVIKLEFENNLADFTLIWLVADINHGRIKLYAKNGNRIILEKKCDTVFDHTKERIKNILSECLWRITRLHIDGVEKDGEYIGTPLRFFENGVVKLRINGELVQGQWDVVSPTGTTGHILLMSFDGRPDLNLHWRISLLGEDLIKLTNQNSQLIIKRFCNDNDDDVVYINQILNEGKWMVALFENKEGNRTEVFEGYVIDFRENGGIFVQKDNDIIDGSWLTFRNDGKLILGLNFGLEPPFKRLNHRWKIKEINEHRIKLIDLAYDGSVERVLVLERN